MKRSLTIVAGLVAAALAVPVLAQISNPTVEPGSNCNIYQRPRMQGARSGMGRGGQGRFQTNNDRSCVNAVAATGQGRGQGQGQGRGMNRMRVRQSQQCMYTCAQANGRGPGCQAGNCMSLRQGRGQRGQGMAGDRGRQGRRAGSGRCYRGGCCALR